MANVCACGCGQLLAEGSTREYKRGHKSNPVPPEGDGFTEVQLGEDSEPLFTIADAAGMVPDDPEPADVQEFKPQVKIRVTAAVRRDVEGMLALGFGMAFQMWSMVDPLCGGVAMESGPNMAKKYTPLVCQSPTAVRLLTKSGKFALWIDAGIATWPVAQVVIAHHVAKSVGRQASNGQAAPAPEAYTVQ